MRYIFSILKWPFGWLNSLTFGFFFFWSFSKRLCNWTLSFLSMPHFWQPFLTFNIFFTIWRGEKFWNQVLAPFCWIALSSMYPFSHILLQEARRNQTASSTLCLETPSASIASCTFHVIAVDNFATFSAYYKARIPLPSVFNNLFFIFLSLSWQHTQNPNLH